MVVKLKPPGSSRASELRRRLTEHIQLLTRAQGTDDPLISSTTAVLAETTEYLKELEAESENASDDTREEWSRFAIRILGEVSAQLIRLLDIRSWKLPCLARRENRWKQSAWQRA